MLDYLKTVFGEAISVAPYSYPSRTPYYIRDGYHVQRLSWNGNECVILSPSNVSWRLPTLKKQLEKFQEISDVPCALGLENMTALQRRNLLENHVPFVSRSQQVYLPFWGCSFIEQFKTEVTPREKMAPGTQLIFMYLYYAKDTDNINLTTLSKTLGLSKATCTRAVNDLTASGLLSHRAAGTSKWIAPAFAKPEFLKKGYARLKSPVERLVYVKEMSVNLPQVQSGIKALSAITMVGAKEQDRGMAIFKKYSSTIPAKTIQSQEDFEDFGGSVVEVWSYDPLLLAQNGHVDDISLLLSLEDDPDERIQMGLDEIREKHGLPIKQNELEGETEW